MLQPLCRQHNSAGGPTLRNQRQKVSSSRSMRSLTGKFCIGTSSQASACTPSQSEAINFFVSTTSMMGVSLPQLGVIVSCVSTTKPPSALSRHCKGATRKAQRGIPIASSPSSTIRSIQTSCCPGAGTTLCRSGTPGRATLWHQSGIAISVETPLISLPTAKVCSPAPGALRTRCSYGISEVASSLRTWNGTRKSQRQRACSSPPSSARTLQVR
mmetsp:Transcript_160815/g.285075  ORF Transcript_160815/g.285075 Transcript_160815/m.285075 type:complete len:214 (+) Transcript_160815:357-998(+)